MKHKEKFLKDVRFYLKNRHRFIFTGSPYVEFPVDVNGIDELTAFKMMDSNGKLIPTRHPNLATTLLRVKASVNFQIKEWKLGIRDGLFGKWESKVYLSSIDAPDWVWKALNSKW